ncbi:MAG: RNA polymerase factor sigma-54 [Pseudomonadota bacterium]
MGLAQRLAIRQGQSLVMTPQLSLSIKLLAMSSVELSNFVDEQLEKNPFLEPDQSIPNGREEQSVGMDADARNDSAPDFSHREFSENLGLGANTKGLEADLGTSLENAFPDEKRLDDLSRKERSANDIAAEPTHRGREMSTGALGGDYTDIASRTAAPIDLPGHLCAQLALVPCDPTILLIAKSVANSLDDNGYLDTPVDTLAERLNVPLQAVDEALMLVQSLEPAGIAARSLQECLALQLKALDRLDPAMQTLLDNLNLLAKRDFDALKRICKLSMGDLIDAAREIKALDPKPGAVFTTGNAEHVIPDVFVTPTPEGGWNVELNTDVLPRVLVNNRYAVEIKPSIANEKDRQFVTDCLQDANWLTKSLDQRAQTILKVSREIVKQQDAFLLHGVRQLKPLTLKTVADAIDMHESSVSRVTTEKYIMTPRGLFSMKYFFTTAINATGEDESHSAEAVRDQIKDMIARETSTAVLSDDAIVAALRASGIDIARRTIAKYRDAMRIPSSVQRRREKRALESAK